MSDTTHISETVSAGQLRAFIERVERLEEEIKTLNGDKSEVYKEMRGCGFDVKAVRQCVAARKLDSAEREERNAIFDLYWSALTGSVHVHTPAREIIEEFPPHDPETGEITDTQEQPETANEVPAQDGGGTATGESPSDKSNAAHPVSEQELADADLNDGTAAGQTAIEVVTAGETATHSSSVEPSSQATPKAGEAIPPASPATISRKINPNCRRAAKGEQCALSHSQASCWKCQQIADEARRAA